LNLGDLERRTSQNSTKTLPKSIEKPDITLNNPLTMKPIILLLLFFTCTTALAQRTVSGVVKDKSDGSAIAGVNVLATGTSVGTTTDADGKFSLEVPSSATTLSISYVGFKTQTVDVTSRNTVEIDLEGDVSEMQELVVVGSRGAQRAATDTPLPVDILAAKDITSTGQYTFDKALQYRVPSFNTVQTPVNDATSLLDPYEIRNMGPSRTLILINGKRKNSSALIYTQTSPGRGETGIDISAIPTDAIERVEILRDGASAQYGSDAIAGVMNIILKNNSDQGAVTLRTGVTGEGDGEMIGFSLNNGTSLFNKGFLNYTIDLSKVGLANRPGTVDAEGELADFGGDINDIRAFLAKKPDAGNVNGSPETTAAKFLVNGGSDIDHNNSIYFNAAYIYKKVNSFANYRTPYWRTLADYPYLIDFFHDENGEYMGYAPTFDGDLNDYNATIGFKSNKNDWTTDLSLTVGGNKQTYTIRNTHNRNTTDARNPDTYRGDVNGNGVVDPDEIVQGTLKYRENSPITFRGGGSRFNHVVGNIDVSKALNENVYIAFGSEFRSETYETIEGDLASYEAGGADSYAGNSAENSFISNRTNFGGYVSLGYDITENFLIDATGRFENYSDFGDAFVYKFSTRYKFLDDKVILRGSYSTGFRAPSLHQIYTQKAQYSFVPGAGIQVSGLANNVSPQIRLLDIAPLDAEKSKNITVGLGLNITDNLSFTVDYYNIKVEDRIVLSNEIGPTDDPTHPLNKILNDNGIVSISFFTNAIDTKTSGIDVVGTYRRLEVGSGFLNFNLAANYTIENGLDGPVKNPEILGEDQSVIDATQEALLFTSRPEYKAILGIDFQISKFTFSLNNTLFGPTKFRNSGMDESLGIEFLPKVVTDLGVAFQLSDHFNAAFNVNNILDVLPEWEFKAMNSDGETLLKNPDEMKIQSNLITFNQRYSTMSYDGFHFSQLGSIFNLTLKYTF
jgi:iron complex outermembrane recepter protein